MAKKHRLGLFLGAALSAFVVFAGISGCDDDEDIAVTTTGARCGDACARYQACFAPSFNVASCTSQCQSAVDNRTIVVTDVDDCLDCIGDNVCAPAYNCADACDLVVIVP